MSKQHKNIRLGFGSFLLFAILPTVAHSNIIDVTYGTGAGSFELGAHSGAVFDALSPGATNITGWTVGGPGNGVDWLTTPMFAAADGTFSVDLQNSTPSSVATVIPTDIGAVYAISFQAATFGPFMGGTALDGTISAGSLVNQMFNTIVSGTTDGQVFVPFTFQFTANAAFTTVTFQGGSTSNTYGPVIDDVSVVRVVPLPAAVWLMFSAVAGLSFWRRRSART